MTLRIVSLFSLLMVSFIACKDDSDMPQAVICRAVSITDQLDVSGKLTNQMQRTFTYTDGQLTQMSERNTDRDITLALEYDGTGRVTRASNGTTVVTLTHTPAGVHPTSATITHSGAVQTIYELVYNSGNRLTRVLETRQVIPTNSFVRSREYALVYDADGLLKTEKLISTLTDRTTVEQETDYTYGSAVNPMGNFTQPGLLTVVALGQRVEAMPGRFWQTRVLQEYKTYSVKNGTRGALRETATFTTKMDENGRLAGQEQSTVTTSASGQNTQRKNQHSISYECK